ncbi:hypothetical protein [Ilumatobacter sp.]|uniref:hypothetical protein n=1 Tax=Ilumatobacter sp. TaxID=1967498 RepID=UPI003B5191D0
MTTSRTTSPAPVAPAPDRSATPSTPIDHRSRSSHRRTAIRTGQERTACSYRLRTPRARGEAPTVAFPALAPVTDTSTVRHAARPRVVPTADRRPEAPVSRGRAAWSHLRRVMRPGTIATPSQQVLGAIPGLAHTPRC